MESAKGPVAVPRLILERACNREVSPESKSTGRVEGVGETRGGVAAGRRGGNSLSCI